MYIVLLCYNQIPIIFIKKLYANLFLISTKQNTPLRSYILVPIRFIEPKNQYFFQY
jgi:hypothetical protein